MQLTSENITQIIVAFVAALGGYLAARAASTNAKKQREEVPQSIEEANRSRIIIERLRSDLDDCNEQRERERQYYFQQMYEMSQKQQKAP